MAKKILILCSVLISMLIFVPGVFAVDTGTAIVSGNPALSLGLTADAGSAIFGDAMQTGDNFNTSINTVNVHVVSNAPWAVGVSDVHTGAAGGAGYMAEWDGGAWVADGKVLSTPLEIGATPITTFPLSGAEQGLFSGIAGTFDNYPCFKQVIVAEPRVATGHSYRMVTTFTASAT